MAIDLSIVIVSFNVRGHLERCLQALGDAPPVHSHEVIVVDNASADASAEAARRWPAVRVIEATENLGFAGGTNVGVRSSSGTNLLFLNSDTVVPAGAIDVLLFPGTYQLAGSLLAEDAIVTVRGKLSRSKDQPEIRGEEVTLPDLTDDRTGPVVVSMPITRCTPPVVDQLKEVLRTHPGVTEVHLRLLGRQQTTVMRVDDRLRVAAGAPLFADLKQLLGPGCLSG